MSGGFESVGEIIGSLVAFGFMFLIIHQFKKIRTKKMRELAKHMGMNFYEDAEDHLPFHTSDFELFEEGYNNDYNNLITKKQKDMQVCIFDYSYKTGGGRNSRYHSMTVMAFKSSDWRLPGFTLNRQNFIHNIGKAFGYQDIDFSSHPTFSKKFLLRGKDEKKIRETFNRKLLSHCERMDDFDMEGAGKVVILYKKNQKLSISDIPGNLKKYKSVTKLFSVKEKKKSTVRAAS